MDTRNPPPAPSGPLFSHDDVVFVYTPDDAVADGFLADLADDDPDLAAPGEPVLELGRVVATPGVLERVDRKTIIALVNRHQSGDWGDVEHGDARANDRAVRNGDDRVLSAYDVGGERVWVLTEWDRSATTVCLPHEY